MGAKPNRPAVTRAERRWMLLAAVGGFAIVLAVALSGPLWPVVSGLAVMVVAAVGLIVVARKAPHDRGR